MQNGDAETGVRSLALVPLPQLAQEQTEMHFRFLKNLLSREALDLEIPHPQRLCTSPAQRSPAANLQAVGLGRTWSSGILGL